MAVAPIPPLVPAEEYLNSSYRPDMEYVDGVLVERGIPTFAHGLLQMILIQYLARYQKALGFRPVPEVRTQIVERSRYRIPDIMLCPVPLSAGKVMASVPWAIIEILSPDDRMPAQLDRFRDYTHIGVRHVLLLDPERLVAFRFEDGSLLQTQFTSLALPSGPLPFDSAALFQQLVEEQSE
ncbi:MAG: Uma2 family endonuclease [Bryobacteraceae bacterium]